ncbi:MAG TPA: class I SAM-dependent DNA methyltransferase [Exilispira sp.]|nr:class I SAM-dependent DNA methyltransferase [Exilispira sp.]
MGNNKKDVLEKQNKPLEQALWESANKLRKNIDAAEYKHVVLGLIFLRYISEAFEDLYEKLKKGENKYEGADPEDKDEYKAENVFFIPSEARWNYLKTYAKNQEIGKIIDKAMDLIENENSSLKGVLPKVYARGNIDSISLGGLIDLFSNIKINEIKEKTSDILGHVFEYFLGQFALAEGKKGGQFYTPRCIVELLIEMLEPYKGRVFDPCCGSGGMFVQSEKFVKEHQGRINDISIYGQESNQTTWRLCKMNLAIRGIDSSQVKWNPEGSFLNDAHKDLKADFVIANPPFNDSDWSGALLRKDDRWNYGVPPEGNANYAWIQHFIFHLSPNGKAGFVLAKGSLTTKSKEEYEIRKNMIEDDIIDCIVNLPAKLFLNTQIPASLWFIRKNKTTRKGQILFIDGRDMGQLIDRSQRVLTENDIRKIADIYHIWQKEDGSYEDIKGFCKSATIEEVRNLDYVLTPGRYVGLADEEDNFDFEERFNKLKVEFLQQLKEEERLNKLIIENLEKIEIKGI